MARCASDTLPRADEARASIGLEAGGLWRERREWPAASAELRLGSHCPECGRFCKLAESTRETQPERRNPVGAAACQRNRPYWELRGSTF
jgi:hypothetical protein